MGLGWTLLGAEVGTKKLGIIPNHHKKMPSTTLGGAEVGLWVGIRWGYKKSRYLSGCGFGIR